MKGYRDCTYTLTASLATDDQLITEGTSYTADLSFLESRRFYYPYTENSGDIRIIVTELSTPASLQLFVTLDGSEPYSENHSYITEARDGRSGVIVIARTDTSFIPCTTPQGCAVRMLLYGTSSNTGTFILTASSSLSGTALLWGVSVRDTLRAGAEALYIARFDFSPLHPPQPQGIR